MKVKLNDEEGKTVLERTIPPYDLVPGVIMWNSKLYVYLATSDVSPTPESVPIHEYRETFMHHIDP